LEEKLIYYADRRACEYQLVSVDERISDLKKRYPDIVSFMCRAESKIKILEKEIFEKINVSIWLEELKEN